MNEKKIWKTEEHLVLHTLNERWNKNGQKSFDIIISVQAMAIGFYSLSRILFWFVNFFSVDFLIARQQYATNSNEIEMSIQNKKNLKPNDE